MPNVESIFKAPQPVDCECGFRIFDGEVIRSRVVKLFPVPVAKCRCREWVRVPVVYFANRS